MSTEVNGYALAVLAVGSWFVICFIIAKPPTPALPGEGCFDAASRIFGNLTWWLIFIATTIYCGALLLEAAGFDAVPGFGPRGGY